MRRAGPVAALFLLAFLLDGGRHSTPAWEYGLLNDFHFSVREELSGEEKFQIDNYYAMDVYRIGGKLDFHSAFLITNDLNLLDREAIQLTLAYLSLDRLAGRFSMRAGRQFFAEGYDAFIGDGVYMEYRTSPLLQVSLHVGVPFDAESEAIEDEPMLVYGLGLKTSVWGGNAFAPLTLFAHVERRDRTTVDGLDQTLVGLKAAMELSRPVANDLYGELQYEAEDGRMRGIRFGSRLYFTPRLVCNLEGERYDPDRRKVNDQVKEFLSDGIVNYFSGSEVWSGRVAFSYSLPRGREAVVSYGGHWYERRSGDRAFGNGVDLFFTFLSMPSTGTVVGAGYSGRVVKQDQFHLGVLRASTAPAQRLEMRFLAEAGILDTRSWDNDFVLHVRGSLLYLLRPNLRVSLGVEENVNPYFDSDLRGMVFVRYFWNQKVE